MIASRNLNRLDVVDIAYDGTVDYGNKYVLLVSKAQGDIVSSADLIASGTIYHVDTSTFTEGERIRQGYVSRVDSVNGKIKIDLTSVLREQVLAPSAPVLTYPAHRILNVFVDIDLWSEGTEYSVVRQYGLITELSFNNPVYELARIRVTAECAY